MLTSPAMPPFYVRDTDPPAKREILRAAMKLFSQHGLAATTIRDIAKESGFTNPALYKHFAGKEELALYLFETSHRRLWSRCHAAVDSGRDFDAKLENYIREVLSLVDEHPEAMAFLSETARVLWPKAGAAVRRNTMIALARSVMSAAPRVGRAAAVHPDVAAASLQGTLAELARMIQVGAVRGPAVSWTPHLVTFFRQSVGA
jgi:TetR/AcrR family transcriptional regulator, repressor of fatR-cypB operon